MPCLDCSKSETPYCPECGTKIVVPRDQKLAKVLEDTAYIEDIKDIDWLTIAKAVVSKYDDLEIASYVGILKFIDKELS